MKLETLDLNLKTLGGLALEVIRKNAAVLRAENPNLSDEEAVLKFLETDEGAAAYRGYVLGLHRGEQPAKVQRIEKRAEVQLGPVATEVMRRKEGMIEKSARRLSEAEAIRKVFEEDPGLYRRYVREIEVSTAVR